MMKLMSNDKVNNMNLNKIKLISKKAWRKRKENILRRGSWLIHHLRVIYINTVFEKPISSENRYILILCCQWWNTINIYSNRWTNWSYSKISFAGISAEYLSMH